MKKIKSFLKTISLFLFCLEMIYKGYKLDLKKVSLKEIWKYCEQWEKGEL